MVRSTMTINTKFNVLVETFCREYSTSAVSNVVPEKGKKKFSNWFSEKQMPIEPKKVLMNTKTNKRLIKIR